MKAKKEPADKPRRLALEGGVPVRREPFAPWPDFAADEIEAVAAVLRLDKVNYVNYWTGEQSQEFEREFAEVTGVKYAVAVSNGTPALALALRALGIGPGDEVVVLCETFIAPADCVVNVRATPVIAEIDPDSRCRWPADWPSPA